MAKKNADLEEALFRPDEEVAGFPREHDRFVGSVDALISEFGRALAQALPGIAEVIGKLFGQGVFGGRPAAMWFALFNPVLAVEALPAGHGRIVRAKPILGFPAQLSNSAI